MDRPNDFGAPQILEPIHGVRRRRTQADDDGRADGVELGPEPRTAGFDLFRSGLLVEATLAALLELEVLDRIREVDLGARKPGPLQGLVEDPARGADEDGALTVLDVPGLLPDQEETGPPRPFPEHGPGGRKE